MMDVTNAPNLRRHARALFELASGLLLNDGADLSAVEHLPGQLASFETAYLAWRATDQPMFVHHLRKNIIIQAHNKAVMMGTVNHDPDELQHVLDTLAALTATYKCISDGDDNFITESRSLSVLNSITRNPFWKHMMTRAEIVHELLIDDSFHLTPDRCFPSLSSTAHADIVAVTVWSCYDPEHIESVCSASPGSLLGIINGLMPGHMSTTTSAEAARLYRTHAANVTIDAYRDRLGHLPNSAVAGSSFWSPQTLDLGITSEWLKRTMQSFDKSDMEAVRRGDSNVMLHVHDIGIILLACSHDPIPEILQYDDLRFDFIRVELEDDGRRRITPAQLCEGVLAGNWRDCSAPAEWVCSTLHRIIMASRIAHGDTVSKLAYRLAVSVLLLL